MPKDSTKMTITEADNQEEIKAVSNEISAVNS